MSIVEIGRDRRVGIVKLNRPNALNALNMQMLEELAHAMETFAADEGIGAILLLGGDEVFSAGADIKENEAREFPDVFKKNWQAGWTRIADIRIPIIAGVKGLALGGGCELAMSCDMIVASENAKFGQPEIKLGVIPGMGGTQRLTRSLGKAKAADLLFTGRMMCAEEAERSCLVSRVVATDSVDQEAMQIAQNISEYGRTTAMLLKAAYLKSFETTLTEGLSFERMAFHSCFATEERSEGMMAFTEKRQALFNT